jgi:hypothetical protein
VGLNYKLNRAAGILASLTGAENHRLNRICIDIRGAEGRLAARSAPLMEGCLERCQGLCCRNAAFDDIIGLADFVYILHGAPHLEKPIRACLVHEAPFFTADCPFLLQGRGPCIFADDLRPEVCITTFCADTTGLRGEIRAVRRGFAALNRFLMRYRLRAAVTRRLHVKSSFWLVVW